MCVCVVSSVLYFLFGFVVGVHFCLQTFMDIMWICALLLLLLTVFFFAQLIVGGRYNLQTCVYNRVDACFACFSLSFSLLLSLFWSLSHDFQTPSAYTMNFSDILMTKDFQFACLSVRFFFLCCAVAAMADLVMWTACISTLVVPFACKTQSLAVWI